MIEKLQRFYAGLKSVYSIDEYYLLHNTFKKLGIFAGLSTEQIELVLSNLKPSPLLNKEPPALNFHRYTGHLKSLIIIALNLPLILVCFLLDILYLVGITLFSKIIIIGEVLAILSEGICLASLAVIIIPALLIHALIISTIINTMSYAEAYIADFFLGGLGGDEPGYERIRTSIANFADKVKNIDLNIMSTLDYCMQSLKNFGANCIDNIKFGSSYLPIIGKLITLNDIKPDDIDNPGQIDQGIDHSATMRDLSAEKIMRDQKGYALLIN